MINQYKQQVKRLGAIFLSSILLLTACAPPKVPEEAGQYEQYHADADSESIQQQFDAFTQELFQTEATRSGIDLHYLLADPSTRGIQDFPATFGEFSVEAIKKDREEKKKTKEQLESFNPRNLTDDQKLIYQILLTYLDTELSTEGLELYAEPLSSTIGIQAELPILLAEYTFYTKKDVDNYLSMLSTIDEYYGQLLEFEKQKSAAGLFMSDRAADHVLESCEAYLVQPDHSFLYETFNTRIDGLSDVTQEERQAYKKKNLEVLTDHFVPAYKLLIDGITSLMGSGVNEYGVCRFPQGKAYYEYLIASSIAPSYSSVGELKKAIEKQIDAELSSMARLTKENPEVMEQLENYAFRYTKPEESLDALKSMITEDFPELPDSTYTVKYVPEALQASLSPAFYLTPPIDRYQDNVIYINQGKNYVGTDLFTTLAHEGYPGHLYQTVYFIAHNTHDLRSILSFPSYSEGWATYVENYAYTLDNGLSKELGTLLALNNSVSLGLYAYLDISINYDGWDREQVAEYLSDYYDTKNSDVANLVYDALVENPTNYLEYYVGYLEISQMRDTAKKVLQDRYDPKAFHTFLLNIGPAQFSVIAPKFQIWLEEQRKSSR